MAIKNYIVKNKKKSTYIFLAFVVCIVSVFAIINASKTKAGVFVKDKDGDEIQKNEIHVLEIIARQGQQVLGYTVEGEEPISKEDIESYAGPMNLDVDDFRDATGYEIEKKENVGTDGVTYYTYKVLKSQLNKTFNEYILDNSMAVGEIKVNAVEANALRESDIKDADLIYINSNDYNKNLLYYYDQFVCNGTMGIQPGDMGADYAGSYSVNMDKYEAALSKIIVSTGDKKLVGKLTDEDFDYIYHELKYKADDTPEDNLALDNYKAINIEFYKQALLSLGYEALPTEEAEAIPALDSLFAENNTVAQESAIKYIQSLAGKVVTEEQKVDLDIAFIRGGYTNYIPANLDGYCNKLKNYRTGISKANIVNLINNINTEVAGSSLDGLLLYKAKATEALGTVVEEGADPYGFTEEDYATLYNYFRTVNQGVIIEDNLKDYVDNFLAEEFVYTATDAEAIRGLIDNTNASKKAAVLDIIAGLPGDTEALKEFRLTADKMFELSELENYNKYYLDNYLSEIEALTDTEAFKTDGSCDVEKINTFLKGVNENVHLYADVDVETDMLWNVARSLYETVISEDVALMYNTELLTSKEIGDYSVDLSVSDEGIGSEEPAGDNTAGDVIENGVNIDNNNNVYKMLLLLRQIQPNYYNSDLKNKIDSEGVYYSNGFDEAGNPVGDGVSSWYTNTFGEDKDNYAKFREPDVVGATYDESGNAGNAVNYVHNRVYSFTGDQFFGGQKFIGIDDTDNGVVTAIENYHELLSDRITKVSTDRYIIISTLNYQDYRTKEPVYVHFVNDEGKDILVVRCNEEIKNVYGNYNHYSVDVPEVATGFYLAKTDVVDAISDVAYDALHTSIVPIVEENVGSVCSLSSADTYEWRTPYSIDISNVEDGKVIEYLNGCDITLGNITAISTDSLKYSVDGGADMAIPLDSAGVGNISVGVGEAVGTEHDITIKYTPEGGYSERVITAKYVKIGASADADKLNYKSMNTATNNTGIANDVLLTENQNGAIVGKNKADVLMYLMRISLMSVSYPIEVLEVQPQANVSDLNNADMAKKILNALKVDIPSDINKNYSKYVHVTSMSVKEFNTRNDELSATYDMIYFGINSGYQVVFPDSSRAKGRTTYNDKTMDGLVYTGIGDQYYIHTAFGGVAADDFEFVNTPVETRILSYIDKKFGLDANGGKTSEHTNIQCWSPGHEFKINVVGEYNGENIVTLERSNVAYVGVDKTDKSDANGVNVELRKKEDNNFYKWIMHKNSDGTFSFENYGYFLKTNQQYYIDLDGGSAKNGTNIKLYKSNDSNAQKWVLGSQFAGGQELYDTWKKYFTTGMVGNSNPSWNLSELNNVGGYYYMKNQKKTTRLGGNDITVRKMEELLDYLKSGYPILLADELMNCDNSDLYDDSNKYGEVSDYKDNVARWPYVDHHSKMYNFILQAKALGKDSSGNFTGLDSNGNRVFKDNRNYASLISVSMMADGTNPEYLPAEQKFEGGLRYAFRRVEILDFKFISGPLQYDEGISAGNTGNIIDSTMSDYTSYDIRLGFEGKGRVNESQIKDRYIYKVYVDKSGVGKFEDADTITLSPAYEFEKDSDGYVTGVHITGNWPGNIEGFIPWKVEAVDVNNSGLKYTYVGNSAFKRNEVKDVYVVWVKYNNLKLNFLDTVKTYASNFKDDYRLHLITISLSDFVNYYKNDSSNDDYRNNKDSVYDANTSKLKVKALYNYAKTKSGFESYNMGANGTDAEKAMDQAKLDALRDNVELDMIVLGFTDSYSGLDINDIAALKNLEYFVNSGHSMLYSHDSSSFNYTINRYSKNGWINQGGNDWARYETYFLRSLVGQDRYGVTCSEENLPEEYVNARMYLDKNKLQQSDLRGITETWTFIGNNWGGGGSDGIKGNKLYSTSVGGTAYADVNSFKTTTKILRMNKGQITTYPFVLPDTSNSNFSVATTHTQYNELNLEDSETTVWYTLDDSSNLYYYTKGDGYNNYYIYSKGNVTYTGAGHSSIGGANEQKLFINTLVASIKTGNYAPDVKVNNAIYSGSGKFISRYEDSGVNVSFTVSDYDLDDGEDNGYSDFRIYIDKNGDGEFNEGDILINDPDNPDSVDNTYMRDTNNNSQKINITKNNLKNRVTYAFYMSNEDLNDLETKLGGSIYDYTFVVEAVDNGYLKAKEDVYREGTMIKASDSFKLVKKTEPNLFNLN